MANPINRFKIIFGCIFLLMLVVCLPPEAFAQQADVKHYKTTDGLLSDDLTIMTESSEGYLWFGSADKGLFWFDGFQSRQYAEAKGLAGDSVNMVFEDSRQQLWVSTSTGGIAKIKGDSLVYPFLYESLNYQEITSITESSDHNLLFGTSRSGIFLYHPGTKEIQQLTEQDGLPSNKINELLPGQGNMIWIATDRGLALSDGEQIKSYYFNKKPLTVNSIFIDRERNIWIAADKGLLKMGSEGLQKSDFWDDSLGSVIDVTENRSGDLLIASSKKGFYKWVDNRLVPLKIQESLNADDIRGFYRDRQKNIWIYTSGEGVLLIRNEAFLLYGASDTASDSRSILDIQANGPQDYTWFAAADGLKYWDEERKTFNEVGDGPAAREGVKKIAQFANGDLLLLTDTLNLYRFDGNNYQLFAAQSRALQERVTRVYDIFIDDLGQIIAASDEGLLYLGEEVKQYTTDDGLPSNFVWHILQNEKEHIWVSTSKGLVSILDNGEIRPIEALQELGTTKYYRHALQDRRGNYWLGTNEGIIWYSPASEEHEAELQLINNRDGLLAIDTQFLTIDSRNYLWHGTTAGIHKIDLAAFYQTREVTPVHYSLTDKRLGIAFNRGAVSESENGILWLGSKDGAVSHNLNTDSVSNGSPVVRITNVEVSFNEQNQIKRYNTSVNSDSSQIIKLQLSHYENNLGFNFMALDYEAPEKIVYRYKLEGYDAAWSSPDDIKKVSYSNLPPGSYTFKVEARDGHGIRSNETASFGFSIKYPFWQSNRFYGILILLIIGLMFGFMKIWLNTYEKRKLEELVNRQTKDLRAGLKEKEVLLAEIHHRVKNNLAVISGLIELQKNSVSDPEAVRSMQETQSRIKSIAMIHEKLYKADSFTDIKFQDYIEELVRIISESYNLKGKNIKTHVDAGDVTVTLDQSIPCGLILNELLSNSYEHAFEGRESGNIYVNLHEENEEIVLKVRDDGIGMGESSAQLHSGSLGMTLVDILTQQLEGHMTTKNTIGTTFIITFEKLSENAGPME